MGCIVKVVSGGQTGVDRAALDAAMEFGLLVGGWCPKGRRAEDGLIPHCYPLVEMSSSAYARRTERNVCDSDGTLIVTAGKLTGGTRLTAELAVAHGRPLRVVDITSAPATKETIDWLGTNHLQVLNVAGPRESGCPGIYRAAKA
jgi:predicted Rossmann fold nucleotide-binding protein DprA/Smf involved in DNA uptake